MQSLHRLILGTILFSVATHVAAQDRISWITDLRQARTVAESQNRLVLLHFWSEHCAPCQQIERNVFNQPEFIRVLTTGYVPVKINANQQPQLAKFYNIESLPTDVIVTPQGREVQRFQSLQDSNQYIAMLDGIRAQASVGAFAPPSSNDTIATGPEQVSRHANPGHQMASHVGQTGYGQTAFGFAQGNPGASDSSSTYSHNRYSNPVAEQSTRQQQDLAAPYANPYVQQSTAGQHSGGSRWDQPNQRMAANDTTRAQQTPSPQGNGFAIAPQRSDSGAAFGGPLARPEREMAPDNGSYGTQQRMAADSVTSGGQVQTATPQPPSNSNQPSIALEGYCPVTLVHNRVWTPGDKKWGAVHEGRVYLFAGPEQQRQFLANPHVYAPLMSGYDPVRFAETGQFVHGRREFGLYIDEPGPIALFADEAALERFHANSAYYFNYIRQARQQPSGQATR